MPERSVEFRALRLLARSRGCILDVYKIPGELPCLPGNCLGGMVDDADLRDALAEALRRNPALGEDTSPEGLARLRVSVDEVAQELRIKRELEAMTAATVPAVAEAPSTSEGGSDAESVLEAEASEPGEPRVVSPVRRGLIAAGIVVVIVLAAAGAVSLVVKANNASAARAAASASAGSAFAAFAKEASRVNGSIAAVSASAAAEQAASSASASARASRQAELNAAHSAELAPQLKNLDHGYNCYQYGGYDPDNPNWPC